MVLCTLCICALDYKLSRDVDVCPLYFDQVLHTASYQNVNISKTMVIVWSLNVPTVKEVTKLVCLR